MYFTHFTHSNASPIIMQTNDDKKVQSVTSLYASGHPSIQCPQDAIKSHFSNGYYHRLQFKIKSKLHRHQITQQELDIAADFGRFPHRPSDLFLKIFYNVICTLQYDPLVGCVSPSLIGSSGTIPLTIISTIPDIMHHYYHAIVNAQKEILFATMYWEKSESANTIRKAFQDLNKRAGDENRRVIIKLMIDNTKFSHAVQFHSILLPNQWFYYDIPSPEEIPNLSLEVHNYHHFIMGTFHTKFLIIDRKLVLLNSNNIQDRPNIEMMSQYEGEIVDSFYDIFLISWSISFQPNLVCLNDHPITENPTQFGHLEKGIYRDQTQPFSSNNVNISIKKRNVSTFIDRTLGFYQSSCLAKLFIKSSYDIENSKDPQSQPILTQHLNKSSRSAHFTPVAKNLSTEEIERLTSEFTPFIFHRPHEPFPIALVNRSAHGTPGRKNKRNPQDAAWLSAFRYAQKSIFIQTPTLNAPAAVGGIVGACRRGIQVTLWLGWGFNDLREGRGTFQGGTNEQVVRNLYKKLKKTKDGKEQNLEVFWYVAKDQTRPIHFSQKKRNCHVKFMSIDDEVAIMGNANMDSISWYHSQEINTMVDSPEIVQEWMDALYKNQSTGVYGKLNTDGIWNDSNKHL